MPDRMKKLAEKLDDMGWTLHKAIDPVDHSEIVVMDWNEIDGLVNDYETTIVDLKRRIAGLEAEHG